jgi:hypothetical protein
VAGLGSSRISLLESLDVTCNAGGKPGAVAFVLAALRNRGPYPVMVLSGEHGSAKSTFSTILRALLDPNTAPLRALPREDRDVFIAANKGHVLTFDNVSDLPPWLSDTLWRLATGGGFVVRQLYTDQDEVLFDATRPVILNGIEDFVTRPDLADRSLPLALGPIREECRRLEAELWAVFEAEHPRILGALPDVVVHGLRTLPHTRLDRLPRMADFALWATACETALWPAGTFMAAYSGSDSTDGGVGRYVVRTACADHFRRRGIYLPLQAMASNSGSPPRTGQKGRSRAAADRHPGRVWRHGTGAQERHPLPAGRTGTTVTS